MTNPASPRVDLSNTVLAARAHVPDPVFYCLLLTTDEQAEMARAFFAGLAAAEQPAAVAPTQLLADCISTGVIRAPRKMTRAGSIRATDVAFGLCA